MLKNDDVERIVLGIWDDICGRSGGDHLLEDLDEDIQEEIKESWREIVRKHVDGRRGE